MKWWLVCLIKIMLFSSIYCVPSCEYYLKRRIEGVFRYDRHMRYQLTYHNAQIACQQDFGATLANREQLLQALKSGLEECRAGWISLAEVAYPRIHNHWNCGENRTGIISYGIRQNLQEKWDVFCYKEDDDCSFYDRTYIWPSTRSQEQTKNIMLNEITTFKELAKEDRTLLQSAITTTADLGFSSTSPTQSTRSPNEFVTVYPLRKEEEIASVDSPLENTPPVTEASVMTTHPIADTFESTSFSAKVVTRQEIILSSSALTLYNTEINHTKEYQNDEYENTTLSRNALNETSIFRPRNTSISSIAEEHLNSSTHEQYLENKFQESKQLSSASHERSSKITSRISTTSLTTMSSLVQQTFSALQQVHSNPTTEHNRSLKLSEYVSRMEKLTNRSFVSQNVSLSSLPSDLENSRAIQSKDTQERPSSQAMSPITGVTDYSALITITYGPESIVTSYTLASVKEDNTEGNVPHEPTNTSPKTRSYSSLTKPHTVMYPDIVMNSGQQEEIIMQEGILQNTTLAVANTTNNESTKHLPVKTISVPLHITSAPQKDTLSTTALLGISPSGIVKVNLMDGNKSTLQQETDVPKQLWEINNTTKSNILTTEYKSIQQTLSVPAASLYSVGDNEDTTMSESLSYHETELLVMQNITLPNKYLKQEDKNPGNDNNLAIEMTTISLHPNKVTTKATTKEELVMGSAIYNNFSSEHLVSKKNITAGNQVYTNSTLSPKLTFKDNILFSVEKQDNQKTQTSGYVLTSVFNRFPSIISNVTTSPKPTTPFAPLTTPTSTTSLNKLVNTSLDTCGGILKDHSGKFQSPGFPQSYQSDMNCTWIIEARLGYYIILDFLSLVLEEHRNCQYDHVLVYDGKESDNKLLGRFCGSQPPPQLRSTSNMLTVVMRSDSSVEFDGILLQYSSIKYISEGTRLAKGKNAFEGVVEVEYQGIRGYICAKQWTNKEAQVVCHQMGYSGPAVATRIIGEDNAPVAISFIICDGNEAALENCSLKNSGMCGTKERAGVICQVFDSCAVLKSAGVLESGTYTIDPDGVGQGEDQFTVECDMVSDNTTGITVIGHDSESRERVSPCEDPGCYSRIITYKEASMDQLRALTAISEHCEQFVRLECRHIRFLNEQWGWWVSRDGHQITSWGGATTNSGKCACGENGECALGVPSCNCDANDDVWRMDEGAVIDRSTLPIQEIRFGDTNDVPMEMAFHSIGKLQCWGTIAEPPVLQSCAALMEAGISDSGRYVIDPDGPGQGVPQFEVYCDMSSDSGITVIRHDSERRMRVTPCEDAGCYRRELKYEADLSQLKALTKVSERCEQFVRLDCRHIRFIQSGWGWWVSWDGKRMNYWGGANPAKGGCACGKTGTCSSPDKLCNCDNNDNIWRTDDGFLRDKEALPVQAVHFGDTNEFPLEMAYHTIGKLRCRGQAK